MRLPSKALRAFAQPRGLGSGYRGVRAMNPVTPGGRRNIDERRGGCSYAAQFQVPPAAVQEVKRETGAPLFGQVRCCPRNGKRVLHSTGHCTQGMGRRMPPDSQARRPACDVCLAILRWAGMGRYGRVPVADTLSCVLPEDTFEKTNNDNT